MAIKIHLSTFALGKVADRKLFRFADTADKREDVFDAESVQNHQSWIIKRQLVQDDKLQADATAYYKRKELSKQQIIDRDAYLLLINGTPAAE